MTRPNASIEERPIRPGKGLRPTKRIPLVVQQRAIERIERLADGCWDSTYHRLRNGYAVVTYREPDTKKDRVFLAHRAAYTWANGQIPQGLVVDHQCGNRGCVNPDHLRLLTLRQNTQQKPGMDFPLDQCRNGHPGSDMRLVKSGVGKTQMACGSCLKEKNQRQTAKRQAERLANLTPQGVGNDSGAAS